MGLYYAVQAVLLPPDYGEPIIGRQAIADSYRDFAASAQLLKFDTLALDEFEYPGVTMVHLRFCIEYTLDDQHLSEDGIEIYTVNTSVSPAQIVWRHQSLLATRNLTPDT